ncbi:MAG TPA: amino acid adenylation domain-containing protein [Ktedonobacteraceae bacterium]|nr:amino acid adenylation domain-containing protein [Ktedonobacteraceae bacterium]
MPEQDKLAQQRSALSAEQRALLEKWMRGTMSDAHRTQDIPRRSFNGPVALSFAQQRLWFLAQFEPVASIYILSIAVSLQGPLNLCALQQSLSEIARRHEMLRTRFILLEEGPVQVIDPPAIIAMPLADLTALSKNEQQIQADYLSGEEAERSFDLVNGPLWRARLLRLSAREHILLLSMHHLICDGWSMSVLFREIGTLYSAFSGGNASELLELPLHYADYALWQREWLTSERLQEQLRYWKRQLADLPQLTLPTDHPRPALQRFRGRNLNVTFPQELVESLRHASQREGVTLFMILLAGFQVLLARYSGQYDLAVGTPIANRTRSELEGLIGLFVNTLVLRCDLSSDPTVHEFLGQVRQVAISAYAHQDLPFEKLVEELNPQRNLSANPLFQVMFSLQPAPNDALHLAGIEWRVLPVQHSTSLFDLSMNLYEMQEKLVGVVEYDMDLYVPETITRLIGHYQQILVGMAAHPQQRLSRLPLLTDGEREQQQNWNATSTEDYREVCLHELFEAQVELVPDAVAVMFEDQHLTYSTVDRQANQLAHYLQKLGVKPETRVGICLERELLLIVALLGVLKAGGAYVPLDPDYPLERLAFMLADADVAVLLLQKRLSSRLLPQDLPVVFLDHDSDHIWSQIPARPISGIRPDNLAYIIYTSGSTGRPKGAMLTHRGICNRLLWTPGTYSASPPERILQKTPASFDVSVWEFFGPLIAGGCLVLARPGGQRESSYLRAAIIEQQITAVHFVPPMLNLFLGEGDIEQCTSLRYVLCGGESLPYEQQKRFFERLHADLYHLYGPSEASVDVTSWRCDPLSEARIIPIGHPIPHTQLYVLDHALNPAPIGIPGELYLGGVGLARGYLNRPELTAERFIPNPFVGTPTMKRGGTSASEPGSRLYRTGDLVRYRTDGALEFLVRLDQQVKVRGFRVELEEIEAVLLAHPQVSNAAVLLREDMPGEKHLVAYIIQREESELHEQDVRSHLQQRLPEYMLPAAFIFLETFPLMINGKLDRQQLPAPAWETVATRGYVEPTTWTEETLARIWAEVLGLEQISTHANFFEIGGDSILSLLVVARASRAGLTITPRQMFQYQTIAELAAVASREVVAQQEEEELQGTFALLPVQIRFFEQKFAAPNHWNQAMFLEAPYQSLKPAILHQTMAYLMEHHPALRLRFTCQNHAWVQHFATETMTPLPVCSLDLSYLAKQEQVQIMQGVITQTQTSFNLETGPLLRVLHIIRSTTNKQIQAANQEAGEVGEPDLLLLAAHHLVVDGVSWRILLEDFHSIYTGLLSSEPTSDAINRVPTKTTSFKRWCEELQSYASSAVLAQEVDYWLDEARKDVPRLPLDFTAEPTANTEASESIVTISLDSEETRELLQDVPGVYHTRIDEVLLTALLLVCAPWLGRSRLLIDLEGHGREALFESLDLSRTVGWFTNIFPILLTLEHIFSLSSAQKDPGAALKAVKEQLRSVPQHGIGYGLLRYMSPDQTIRERLAALPQAQIIFNYLGQFEGIHSDIEGVLFRSAPLASGALRAPQNRRSHVLAINALVSSRRLHMHWQFSTLLHRRDTIETLAQRYLEELRAIIAHCRAPEAGGYTLSDFPDLGLSQTRLDKLMRKLRSTDS